MRLNLDESGPFIGVGGLAVAAFLFGYSAIALPSWLHSLVMPLIWFVLFFLAVAWFTPRPRRVVWLPFVAVAVWFAMIIGFGPDA